MDFHDYLKALNDAEQLLSVEKKVATDLELAAIAREEFAKAGGGKALLFNSLDHGDIAVAANLFGSRQRLCLMLGVESLQDFAGRIRAYLEQRNGNSLERLQMSNNHPVTGLSAVHLNRDATLQNLPAIRTWPGEKSPYLTMALAVTSDPETHQHNLGLYRSQVLDSQHLAINFSPGSGAGKHLEKARRMNRPLPVALLLGADTTLYWAAAAPLPDGCSELSFCRQLLNADIQLSPCVSQSLQIPYGSDIVIEGEIMPGHTAVEGPFGNHTGQYVTRRECPLMRVTSICMKDDPVMPVTVVGPPPSENILLGMANEALTCEMLRIDLPQITAIHMPLETIFHQAAIIALKYGEINVKDLIKELWRSGPLSRARLIVLVDEDIDVSSGGQIWWRAINRLSAERIYQDRGRIAIDATGVDPKTLVGNDRRGFHL